VRSTTSDDYKQRSSLKGRLYILLAVMLLPFIAFSIYKAIDINNRLEAEIQAKNLSLVKSVAHDIDEYINSTGEVLIPIANLKDVRTQNWPAVKIYLDQIVPKYPFYHLIAFVDVKGNLKVAAMSEKMAKSEDAKKVNVSDTGCYRRGIVANGIAVGDFMYSKLTGMPVTHVTYPVFDMSGKRIGLVAAAFDLTKIQNKLMKTNITQHTVISVVDNMGTYIARNKDPKKWVGKNIADADRYKLMLGKTEGTYKAMSADGTNRVYAFTTASKVPWIVRAGIDEKYILDQVRAELINHFAVFIPLLLIAIIGWVWTERDVNKLHQKTEYLSIIDPLTRLYNCRKLNNDLSLELSRAKRCKRQLSFAMIDIDHFKQYNDNNGHQLGDEALASVAEIIRNAVRDIDSVYRYGGEEMCVVLPETDKVGVAAVAERIRADVEQARFIGEENQPLGKLTISIGVATYPNDSISKEGIIKSADIALYKAKDKGRNKVEMYRDHACSCSHAANM